MLHWIVDIEQIEPHTRVWEKCQNKAALFDRADFTEQAEADLYICYICAAGKSLLRYRRPFKQPPPYMPKQDCDAWSCKPRC